MAWAGNGFGYYYSSTPFLLPPKANSCQTLEGRSPYKRRPLLLAAPVSVNSCKIDVMRCMGGRIALVSSAHLYNGGMETSDPLALFLRPVREWFRHTLGEPTAPQRLGWPAIAAGQNTLILAPTGSGKTLAAFLACLDNLWRQDDTTTRRGVRVLYVSPLKALNNDIHRNLQLPLAGVAETAVQMGQTLPVIEAAVRTGDTSTAERQRLVRRPPHVLISTPESLHLLLTSRARETLRGVTHCIIDEIHALCPNKRGVFPGAAARTAAGDYGDRFCPHWLVGDAAATRRSGPLPRRQ